MAPPVWALAASVGVVLCSGCTHKPKSSGPAPESVVVGTQEVEIGFAGGQTRTKEKVSEFRLSVTPVRKAEYAACVAAGTCAPSNQACEASLRASGIVADAADSPAVCLTSGQAQSYCSWVGGQLPTLAQWFLAGRGTVPVRFSWGNELPSCEQLAHARAYHLSPHGELLFPGASPCEQPGATALAVGQHPAGASAVGIEDVLSTGSEWLRGGSGHFPACADSSRTCLVYGRTPGSIESVAHATGGGADRAASVEARATFRCAFTAEGDHD